MPPPIQNRSADRPSAKRPRPQLRRRASCPRTFSLSARFRKVSSWPPTRRGSGLWTSTPRTSGFCLTATSACGRRKRLRYSGCCAHHSGIEGRAAGYLPGDRGGVGSQRLRGRALWPAHLAVKAAPAETRADDVGDLVREILDNARQEGRTVSLEILRNKIAASVSCHAAIKVNMPLESSKMDWLLQSLAKTECPMTCPHGRPTVLRYGMKRPAEGV